MKMRYIVCYKYKPEFEYITANSELIRTGERVDYTFKVAVEIKKV